MNGQPIEKLNWKTIVEECKIKIHNAEIILELNKAQLKEAMAHARGS